LFTQFIERVVQGPALFLWHFFRLCFSLKHSLWQTTEVMGASRAIKKVNKEAPKVVRVDKAANKKVLVRWAASNKLAARENSSKEARVVKANGAAIRVTGKVAVKPCADFNLCSNKAGA
jgi:hypothetical protein